MNKLILLVLLQLSYSHSHGPLVRKTSSGFVQGVEENVQDTLLHAFKGIPYAKAPIGKLRFQKPQAIEPWNGVYEAKEYGKACTQIVAETDEDCLFLNIITPVTNSSSSELLPVTFHIHGGGFVYGYGMLLFSKLDFIEKSKTVFVTFNYRLGPFGFLKCNNSISGNMGLFDQLLALQWVHDNIKSFGGDPSKLTITGLSAGAASVTYLTSTPLSNGLYSQKVAFSGSANGRWAFLEPKKAEQRCSELEEILECSDDSTIACLNSKSSTQILEAVDAISKHPVDFGFVPSIDGTFVNISPFDSNFKSAISVPSIHVINKDEGTIMVVSSFNGTHQVSRPTNVSSLLSPMPFSWSSFLSAMKSSAYTIDPEKFDELLDLYTSDRNVADSSQYRLILADFLSDLHFICPVMEYASREPESKLYYFIRPQKFALPLLDWLGVSHVNSAMYVFMPHDMAGLFKFTQEDIQTSLDMQNDIISFLNHEESEKVSFSQGYNEILSGFENKSVESHPRRQFCRFIKEWTLDISKEDMQDTCTAQGCDEL